MNRIEQLISVVDVAINESVDTTLPTEIENFVGYSDPAARKFLNKLLAESAVNNYLEIGVWTGSTAISALYNNHQKINHWFIDNWSQFQFDGIKDKFTSDFTRLVGVSPNIISNDCFLINPIEEGICDIDVYFYDGGHEEEDHYKAITHYCDCMKDSFVLIVDDWNWVDRVVKGTFRGIEACNLRIEKQWVTSWWNGFGIFVLTKQKGS